MLPFAKKRKLGNEKTNKNHRSSVKTVLGQLLDTQVEGILQSFVKAVKERKRYRADKLMSYKRNVTQGECGWFDLVWLALV